jgi:hypothetical protein
MDVRIYQQEGRMLEGLRQWRTRRRIAKTATQSLADHRGVAAATWPLTATATAAERAAVAAAAEHWLAEQLPFTATPHGLSRYQIRLGYAAMDGITRTHLGIDGFPPFSRLDAPTAFAALHDKLYQRDLSQYPTLTTVEVYLLSYGDLLKPLYDEA